MKTTTSRRHSHQPASKEYHVYFTWDWRRLKKNLPYILAFIGILYAINVIYNVMSMS